MSKYEVVVQITIREYWTVDSRSEDEAEASVACYKDEPDDFDETFPGCPKLTRVVTKSCEYGVQEIKS